MTATFSLSSLLCRDALPSTLLATSRDSGWTSVLLDRHRVDPGYEPFETRPTPDQTIVVMLKGEQELEVLHGNTWRRASYRSGTIGMTPGGHVDRLRRRPSRHADPFEKANLYIPQQIFRDAAEHYRRAGQRCRETPLTALAFNDSAVAHAVFALLRGLAAGAPDLYAQTTLHWLAAHLLARHSLWFEPADDDRRTETLADIRLARVLDIMTARFADKLTLQDLAAEAGVSKFHFAHFFRARMGAAPHAFLARLRIQAAREMLRSSDASVAEIAAKCGYARASQFTIAFRNQVGVTPATFRLRPRDQST